MEIPVKSYHGCGMPKGVALFCLSLSLLVGSGVAQSPATASLSRHAIRIKHKVISLRTGTGVAVTLKSGQEVAGPIDTIGSSSFTIATEISPSFSTYHIVTVAYEDVKKIRASDCCI